MKTPRLLLCCVLFFFTVSVFGATVTNREAAVRADRATMEKDARWIYSDLARGMTEAKWKGKPLLVVLRCVPCLSCAGIDASVLSAFIVAASSPAIVTAPPAVTTDATPAVSSI